MSQQLSPDYWNGRYHNNTFSWDLGGISTPLQTYFDQLTHKDQYILIPGAGNGYEAEYLISNGFKNVYVCDFAELPLKNLQQRCPALKKEQLLLLDFFELSHLTFDLIIEQTFFCALSPELRQRYFEKMHKLLKPGGKLVGLLFDAPMNTDQPPFGGTKEEYQAYFEGLFKIKTYAACYNSIKPRQGREVFMNLEKI